MQDRKQNRLLPLRRVAGLMMVMCFALALGRLAFGMLPLFDPRLAAAAVSCHYLECTVDRSPSRLWPEVADRPPSASDGAAIDALIARPATRASIAAGSLAAALPAAGLFLALAMALRWLRRRDGLRGAIAWLRRAAVAALVLVVAQPVAATLRATALSPAITGRQQVFLAVDAADLLWGVMVAGTLWVVVRAFEAALATERELAEIV